MDGSLQRAPELTGPARHSTALRSTLPNRAIAGVTARSFLRHETIYRAGERATRLFEVREGAVFVYKLLEDGRRQVVDFVRPGEICGFARGATHDATCEALAPTRLLLIDLAAISRSPELQERVAADAFRNVCALQDHALALGRKTAVERVGDFLFGLLPRRCDNECESPRSPKIGIALQVQMTRGEIADYLGLSLETVCRTLTELERTRLITIGRRHGEVQVHDVCRLCRLAKAQGTA